MTAKLSRRQMLKLSMGFAAGAVIAGCTPATQSSPATDQPTEPTAPKGDSPTDATMPSPTPAQRELLNLIVITSQYGEKAGKNANDVVTPYFEQMYNVKFDVRVGPPDQGTKEAYALYKAAGTLPDMMMGDRRSSQMLADFGDFEDMTDNMPLMPNYTRWVSDKFWPRYKNGGRNFALPQPIHNGNDPRFKGDIYHEGFAVWPLLAREDLLAKCGYEFTPLAEIAKATTDKGVWPSIDQLGITPAIDTPEKFGEFLQQIKDLKIMVGDKPLTPLSSISWSVFHLSSMMDNGHWRIDDNNNVDGYLGTPGAKDFYKLWANWYDNDLLDKDYITQKDDQLQEKWATGRVGTGLYVPNLVAARQALLDNDPTMMVRPIQWPKVDQRLGYFDVYENGFWCLLFNKEIADIPRLVEMIDFANSDEGLDICTWGPPSAGLYTTDSSGKKVYKDEETRTNIMENITGTKNAEYYGVFNAPAARFESRVAFSLPMIGYPIESDPRFNYPPDLKIYDVVPKVYSKTLNCGFNTDGRASYGDGGENSGATGDYFWSKFSNGEIATLLVSKSDAEFDSAWDNVMNSNDSDGLYPDAKKDMTAWFAEFGPKA